ncbi:LOW QUALITY PROTEIN: leukocyte elastase inhibitor-like [Pollicipes pollicipes]|uniref:LOW QUALITY PROTEIN: leukocyte elastase inhibitor-like n=1 Tax=Pollicipes pollicipes TaxID=41117 RepID=UPI0018853D19|nr:LOW QUALITY PROTEIN: leukocyte elastase inhibitor-like [Pollicipes pollicipes]
MEQVSNHQSKAASDLYRVLAEASADNVFLSPFSISTALSMVFGGADGNTALQMQQALALPKDSAELHNGYSGLLRALQDPPNITLNTANKLYVQNAYKILDTYSGLLQKQYLSELKSVDFGDADGTSKLINGDVNSTKGKIKDLIDPSALNSLVRLVLINAIYFKGSWQEKFDKEATSKRDFFVSPKKRCQNRPDLTCPKSSGARDLFVSKVVHKAFIEVNEEGSEAAAATGMVMMMRCMPSPVEKFEFIADHPFFFAIVDTENGLTLFSGRYVKPE